jgi:hypothetical protein
MGSRTFAAFSTNTLASMYIKTNGSPVGNTWAGVLDLYEGDGIRINATNFTSTHRANLRLTASGNGSALTNLSYTSLRTTNTPSAGHVLHFDGTNMYWAP